MGGLAGLACDRDRFATPCCKAKGMNRSCGQVNECAGRGGDGLVAVTDLDIALDDIEGFAPVMAMRRRPGSLTALLQENLIALRSGIRGQHGDFLADHIERTSLRVWCDDKWLWLHALCLL